MARVDALIASAGGAPPYLPIADLKRRIRGLRGDAAAERDAAGKRFYSAVCDLMGYAGHRIDANATARLERGEDPDVVEHDRKEAMRGRSARSAQQMAMAEKEAACHAAEARLIMHLTELCAEVGGVRPEPSSATSSTIAALESAILARGR